MPVLPLPEGSFEFTAGTLIVGAGSMVAALSAHEKGEEIAQRRRPGPKGRGGKLSEGINNSGRDRRHRVFAGRNAADGREIIDRTAMRLLGKGGAAVGQNRDAEVADMGVAHGRGDAAIGNDASDEQPIDAGFSQHPLHSRHVEGRISNFLDREIGRLQVVDQAVAPAARREIALAEKRAEHLQMR